MTAQDRLNDIANQLRQKKEVQSVTVRGFLGWYGAQRRASWIVWFIRQELDKAGLKTDPDFEAAYIDSLIRFLLATDSTEEDAQSQGIPEGSSGAGLTTAATASGITAYADPTYRISKLAAANK